MKTLFAMGFGSPQDIWGSMRPSPVFLGSPSLGRGLTASEIDQYTAKISAGRQKLAQINAWMDSKRAAQPIGWKLFDDEALQSNFFNWLKTANNEQASVDRIWEEITNPSSADYDVSQDDLIWTNDWATQINWMTGAMEDYGGAKAGPVVGPKPAIKPGRMAPYQPGVTPGAMPGILPPAPEPTVLGIPKNTLLIGAGVVGVGALIAALV